jgi:hypothetical protein
MDWHGKTDVAVHSRAAFGAPPRLPPGPCCDGLSSTQTAPPTLPHSHNIDKQTRPRASKNPLAVTAQLELPQQSNIRTLAPPRNP